MRGIRLEENATLNFHKSFAVVGRQHEISLWWKDFRRSRPWTGKEEEALRLQKGHTLWLIRERKSWPGRRCPTGMLCISLVRVKETEGGKTRDVDGSSVHAVNACEVGGRRSEQGLDTGQVFPNDLAKCMCSPPRLPPVRTYVQLERGRPVVGHLGAVVPLFRADGRVWRWPTIGCERPFSVDGHADGSPAGSR